MITIRFGVLYDPGHPTCQPLIELKNLIRRGRAPCACAIYGLLPGGDCSAVAAALMADLAEVGAELDHEWRHVVGDCVKIGRHRWVEAEGWSFDLSHGACRPAIVMRADAYRAMRGTV